MTTALQNRFLDVMRPFQSMMTEFPPTTELGRYVLSKLGVPLSKLNRAVTDSEERRKEACVLLRAMIDKDNFEASIQGTEDKHTRRQIFNNASGIIHEILDKLLDPKPAVTAPPIT